MGGCREHRGETKEKGARGQSNLHRLHSNCAVALGLLLSGCGIAHAELPAFYGLGPRPDDDILAAGLLYFRAPRYAGSAEIRDYVAPAATAISANACT